MAALPAVAAVQLPDSDNTCRAIALESGSDVPCLSAAQDGGVGLAGDRSGRVSARGLLSCGLLLPEPSDRFGFARASKMEPRLEAAAALEAATRRARPGSATPRTPRSHDEESTAVEAMCYGVVSTAQGPRRYLWCGFGDGTVQAFRADEQPDIVLSQRHHSGAVTAVTFVASLQAAFTAGVDWRILRWQHMADPDRVKCAGCIGSHSLAVRALAPAPPLAFLSGGDDGVVRCWPLPGSELVAHSVAVAAAPVLSVVATSESSVVIAGDARGGLSAWAIASGATSPTWTDSDAHRGASVVSLQHHGSGSLWSLDKSGCALRWACDPAGPRLTPVQKFDGLAERCQARLPCGVPSQGCQLHTAKVVAHVSGVVVWAFTAQRGARLVFLPSVSASPASLDESGHSRAPSAPTQSRASDTESDDPLLAERAAERAEAELETLRVRLQKTRERAADAQDEAARHRVVADDLGSSVVGLIHRERAAASALLATVDTKVAVMMASLGSTFTSGPCRQCRSHSAAAAAAVADVAAMREQQAKAETEHATRLREARRELVASEAAVAQLEEELRRPQAAPAPPRCDRATLTVDTAPPTCGVCADFRGRCAAAESAEQQQRAVADALRTELMEVRAEAARSAAVAAKSREALEQLQGVVLKLKQKADRRENKDKVKHPVQHPVVAATQPAAPPPSAPPSLPRTNTDNSVTMKPSALAALESAQLVLRDLGVVVSPGVARDIDAMRSVAPAPDLPDLADKVAVVQRRLVELEADLPALSPAGRDGHLAEIASLHRALLSPTSDSAAAAQAAARNAQAQTGPESVLAAAHRSLGPPPL